MHACKTRRWLVRLMASASCHSDSSISSMRADLGNTPALLTRMSNPPNCRTVSPTARVTLDAAADPARRAGHERHAAVERATRAGLSELRLLQLPVLDGEQVGLGQRTPAAERLCPLDDGGGVLRDITDDVR